MLAPKAVLFDHDGVLVASEPLHWAAWEKLLAELGVPYNGADMRAYVGRTAPEIIVALLNRYQPGWSPEKYSPVELAKRKNDYYLQAMRQGLRPYPGVEDGLKRLRAQGVRVAVVSNAKRRELDEALHHLGLFALFDEVVSRDDVGAPKPDHSPYLFAAAAVGVAPEHCLAVEDSPTGLQAALTAGISAVGVLTNFSAEMLGSPVLGRPDLKPVHLASSMEGFFEWLATLPRA
jgi:HAD superfamily hydrolase (TIGR01509 family)